MPSHELTASLQTTPPKAFDAARKAAQELGLIVREEGAAFLRVNENRLTMSPWANSVTLTITLGVEADRTEVVVKAKNLGLGPVQSKHVRHIAETFAARLKAVVSRPA